MIKEYKKKPTQDLNEEWFADLGLPKSVLEKLLSNHKIRIRNIQTFKKQFPQHKSLTNNQILLIFKMYSENTRRTYQPSSISMLVSGTLLILITSLFVNAGAPKQISENDIKPNMVVMNTVIASAASGLL